MQRYFYYLKLIPPRTTFVDDMTQEERRLMQQHSEYMKRLFASGSVLIYGPVKHSDGPFGMGVLEAENEGEARKLIDNDPTVRAGMNTYEISPMVVGAARGTRD
jgi:uncharacterized protein